jgi:acyl transferase domain-containing protein
MAAVGFSVLEISEFLLEGVQIVCENSPTSIKISGGATKIGDIMAAIESKRPDVLVSAFKLDMLTTRVGVLLSLLLSISDDTKKIT